MVKLFCVIVGVTGSAFEVDIDEGASVSALKKAIKMENEDIKSPARDLQLFLAKKDGAWMRSNDPDAISMRSGDIPERVEKLLHEEVDPTEEIGDVFGGVPTKKTIHVLVVAPQQEMQHEGTFAQCGDQFFSQLPTVDEVAGWLEFSAELLLTERQRLYIRSSYKSIADQALSKEDPNRRKYAVITGTPGIGKSVFIYYVMWRLITEKKRVLFLTKKPAVYFDGNAIWDCDQLPKPGNRQFWSPDLWCLVDSVDPTGIAELPIEHCSVLLASTPRRDCIAEFKKLAPTPDVFYMPLWTDDELTKIAPLYPHAAGVWRHRLDCLGGVPRLVLQDIQTDPHALLTSSCNSCSLDDCIMLVSIHSEINSKTKIIQRLIHIHSEEPYQDYSVVYASELAMQVIARTKCRLDRAKMQCLLSSCDGNPLAQSLCGYIFEPYVMDLLERGGTFVYRKLLSGVEMRRRDSIKRKRSYSDEDEKIDIPASPHVRQVVERVERGQESNQLYVPRTSNYAAIDAWMPDFGGFQMTVGRSHDIKGGAAGDLAKLGPGGNRLYFLLPLLYYKSFTKKTPQDIEQFAILIPYPEEIV